MASLSFRDRFFSPPVARAVTSPSGILALGAGAAVGLVATAPLSLPLGILGAVVGGALAYGGRVALAIPKQPDAPAMDPFSVKEPWRDAVLDAVRAKARFGEAIAKVQPGPLRDTLTSIGSRIDTAVEECWKIAQQGQLVADARATIDDNAVQRDLRRLLGQIPAGGRPSDTQSRTVASLQSQLATSQRMDHEIVSTRDELGLLNARLNESVTQAIELSVSNRTSNLDPLGNDVDQIVDDLSSLRLAMEDVDSAPPATDPMLPPPLPQATDPGPADGTQTAPGT